MAKVKLYDNQEFRVLVKYLKKTNKIASLKDLASKLDKNYTCLSNMHSDTVPYSPEMRKTICDEFTINDVNYVEIIGVSNIDKSITSKEVHEITISGMTTEQMKAEIARLKTDVELLKQLFIKNNAG